MKRIVKIRHERLNPSFRLEWHISRKCHRKVCFIQIRVGLFKWRTFLPDGKLACFTTRREAESCIMKYYRN